ncbi:MAG: hypothetical protein EOM02_13180, partial [Synergistales bacterium]|nr:hypothetical protein [Synergistales bacterium]
MAEERNKENATIEDKSSDKKVKKKQKSKKGFLIFLVMLALPASLAGLHLSGTWDARPILFSLIPKLPYVGDRLTQLMDIPPVY